MKVHKVSYNPFQNLISPIRLELDSTKYESRINVRENHLLTKV